MLASMVRLLPGTRSGTARGERRDSLENPGVSLSSPQAWALIAGQVSTDAGVNVSEFTALRTMAVWRCIAIISGTISQMPLNVWQGSRRDPQNRKAVDCPLFDDEKGPNTELTTYELFEMTLAHDLLWGNAFWLKIGDQAGNGWAQVWNLPPWATTPTRKPSANNGVPGVKQYQVNVGAGLTLTDADLVHFPGLGYDGIRGLSPIAHARQGLGIGVAAEQFGARLFGSGSLMSGILSTDKKIDDNKAEGIKAAWRQKITGLAKSHEVVVLGDGMTFHPVSIPPEDAQFLQTRQFSVEEVCRLFGVPPHLAMQVDKTTSWGTGIAEQSMGFYRYTLSQWCARLERRITKFLLPRGQYCEFDTSQLFKGDTAARYAAYAVARSSGWLSRNEIRTFEAMPAVEGLDDYLAVPAVPPTLPDGGKQPKGA